jgi:hypothetical protein
MSKRVSNRKGAPSGNRTAGRPRLRVVASAVRSALEPGPGQLTAGQNAAPPPEQALPTWRRWAKRVFGRG